MGSVTDAVSIRVRELDSVAEGTVIARQSCANARYYILELVSLLVCGELIER